MRTFPDVLCKQRLWYRTPSLLVILQTFRGVCCLHLQGSPRRFFLRHPTNQPSVISHKNVTFDAKEAILHAPDKTHRTHPHTFELRYISVYTRRLGVTLGCWHAVTQSALRATLWFRTVDTACSSAVRKSRSTSLSKKLPLREGVFIHITVTFDFLILLPRRKFKIVTRISPF
jgi:hypothetical protein